MRRKLIISIIAIMVPIVAASIFALYSYAREEKIRNMSNKIPVIKIGYYVSMDVERTAAK